MSRTSSHTAAAARALLTALAVSGAGFSEDAVAFLRAGGPSTVLAKENRDAATDVLSRTCRHPRVRPARPGCE
jgi:hypothetical protein